MARPLDAGELAQLSYELVLPPEREATYDESCRLVVRTTLV